MIETDIKAAMYKVMLWQLCNLFKERLLTVLIGGTAAEFGDVDLAIIFLESLKQEAAEPYDKMDGDKIRVRTTMDIAKYIRRPILGGIIRSLEEQIKASKIPIHIESG